jgi:hypothetical protein
MSLLIKVLKSPSIVVEFTSSQWQLLLREANASQLVGRVKYLVEQQSEFIAPDYVSWHLTSAYKIAEKQKKQAIIEFYEVSKALKNLNTQLVFLKGAAYIAKNLPCSFGRTFSDIDILVKETDLLKIERTLKFSDWLKTDVDDYDEKYYRTWMHEIPPLAHAYRGTVLDIHHNILPRTNKNSPDASQFSFENVHVDNVGEIQTLTDLDLVIHTAVHLFTESEFHHGLRDISDIDMLLNHFQTQYSKVNKDFISELISRSVELGLFDYVRLAIRYAHFIFATPLGETKLASLACSSSVLGRLQDFCFINTLKPNHTSCRTWRSALAEFILYWRGHLIRMPLTLLIPHLTKKSWKRFMDIFVREEPNNENMIP